MITRDEFKEVARHWHLYTDFSADDSPLWAVEQSTQIIPQWFVCVKPVRVVTQIEDYWQWCEKHLTGKLLCYSSSDEDQEEWWGFTNKDDGILWILKWA